MKILITGGAGFVGSQLSLQLRQHFPQAELTVFDNLKRRGSELNLQTFKNNNIKFVHGDIRFRADLESLPGPFDWFIEASAEPSVHAGESGDTSYVIQTNLQGTINCLDFARHACKKMIFLSTSRVYSIPALQGLPLEEKGERLALKSSTPVPGLTAQGVCETFETARYRSLYGTTKLASEMMIQEYQELFGLEAVINRCGVIAGPGQWGKVDQGVFTLWVANHFFGKPLRYTGFGGEGKQVRDLLHPQDLFQLILKQMDQWNKAKGQVFNVGGGMSISTSLKELTKHCQEITGRQIEIGSILDTARVDVPWYVSDCSKVSEVFQWRPKQTVAHIVTDIYQWLKKEQEQLKHLF